MKQLIKRICLLALCVALCIPVFADTGDDMPEIGFEPVSTPVVVPTQENEKTTIPESVPSETPQSQSPVADEAITTTGDSMPEFPLSGGEQTIQMPELPAPRHTVSEIRSVIGDSAQIINIDGLDVPLADGSMFYIPFVDIAADAYYTPAVAWAYANDITAGVTELSFGPNQTCTRSQMVTFLWRAAGCPEPTGTASGFSDVAAGSWYEKAVAWAVENKITDGVGGGRFDPNGIVNRAQAVTFLYRAKGAPATTASESFTDVGSGEFYTDAVAWAVANDVTNGVGDNAFAPNANCVRGQTVTFLYRAYK